MAKSSFKVTKNTLQDGLNQYNNVLVNRIQGVLKSSASTVMAKTAESSPVKTGRLMNSFKQGGTTDLGIRQIQLPPLKDVKGRRFQKVRVKPKRDNDVFSGGKDTIGRLVVTDREQSIVFGSSVPYAKYVEFGTSRQKSQFYFTTSFRSKILEVQRIISKGLTIR